MKHTVTVSYPITITLSTAGIKINMEKLVNDPKYKDKIRERIFDITDDILLTSGTRPIITDSTISELID